MFGLKSQNSFSEHFGHRIAYSWWTLSILSLDEMISELSQDSTQLRGGGGGAGQKAWNRSGNRAKMGFWSEFIRLKHPGDFFQNSYLRKTLFSKNNGWIF